MPPLGQGFTLGQFLAQHVENQGAVSQRIRQARQARRDLQIEQPRRRLAERAVAEAHFLAAGVHNHLMAGTGDEFPKSS